MNSRVKYTVLSVISILKISYCNGSRAAVLIGQFFFKDSTYEVHGNAMYLKQEQSILVNGITRCEK